MLCRAVCKPGRLQLGLRSGPEHWLTAKHMEQLWLRSSLATRRPCCLNLSELPRFRPSPPPCRYNLLVADQTGVTLTLLPMLLGFFTYKGAVLGKQSLALFAELSGGQQAQQGDGGADGGGEGGGGTDALDSASVDRAFQKKMLKEV